MIAHNFSRWTKKATIGLLMLGLSMAAPAHEGHDQPAGMPSALHGGKVKESTGGTKKGSEAELFFEAVYEEPNLKLYPLTTDEHGAFKALSPKKDLSNVAVEIEFPRAGKRAKTAYTQTADSFDATVATKGAHRFLVIINASHKGETKKTKVQVETK